MSPMDLQHLAQGLSMAGLAIGTLGYALLVRRRDHERRLASIAAASALPGLVRVMIDGYVPE